MPWLAPTDSHLPKTLYFFSTEEDVGDQQIRTKVLHCPERSLSCWLAGMACIALICADPEWRPRAIRPL